MNDLSLIEVVECCAYCGAENVMMWDCNKMGYCTTCQYCGNELALCSECLDEDSNTSRLCNWKSGIDSCKYSSKEASIKKRNCYIDGKITDTITEFYVPREWLWNQIKGKHKSLNNFLDTYSDYDSCVLYAAALFNKVIIRESRYNAG